MNNPIKRVLVLWAGVPPSENVVREFRQRALEIRLVKGDAEVSESLPLSRAAVFCVSSSDLAKSIENIRHCAEAVVLHGLDLWVVPENIVVSKALQEAIYKEFRRFFGRRSVLLPFRLVPDFISLNDRPHHIAEECARCDPGPPAKTTLKMNPSPDEIAKRYGPTLVDLLRRAFNDCEEIELERLGGGYSARVFKVHARFEQQKLVNRPLPLYAKYDLIGKINKELDNYENLVEAAVPFNLRPNPDPGRCIRRGYTHGLIVGNFVEYSESLWETARRGHGAGPIYSLFDQAFKSWRLNSQPEAHQSVFQDLYLAGIRIDVDEIDPRRIEKAMLLGSTKEPDELLASLKALPAKPHRKGVIHGDLHINNVRARGNDAVLIDFYSVNSGAPLAFDPATLEVSLAFATYGRRDLDNEWKDTILALYDPQTFLRPPEPALQQHKREWLWNCVRQLRTIALSRQEIDGVKEYQTAVAFVLLRRMRHRADKRYPEYRYAFGYVIAERLIADLAGGGPS